MIIKLQRQEKKRTGKSHKSGMFRGSSRYMNSLRETMLLGCFVGFRLLVFDGITRLYRLIYMVGNNDFHI